MVVREGQGLALFPFSSLTARKTEIVGGQKYGGLEEHIGKNGARQKKRKKAKEDLQELYHQFGAPVIALGRQRLAQYGVLPSGAGPKAPMSRASVLFLSLK